MSFSLFINIIKQFIEYLKTRAKKNIANFLIRVTIFLQKFSYLIDAL